MQESSIGGETMKRYKWFSILFLIFVFFMTLFICHNAIAEENKLSRVRVTFLDGSIVEVENLKHAASGSIVVADIYAKSFIGEMEFFKKNKASKITDEGITAEAPIEDYIGSNACKECHQEKYDDWSGKYMSHFVRYRSDTSESIPGNWHNSPIKKDDVFLIVGGRNKVAFADKNWKVFPYQYHIKKQKWTKRTGWINQDYRLGCGPCHTVGLNKKTKRFVEINVGCETCHAPGKNHAEFPGQKKVKVPGKTDGQSVLFTCRKCHNERKKHARAIKYFNGVFHGKGN